MLSKRKFGLLVMVFVGLAMINFLLPGCGSDKKSGDGKTEKSRTNLGSKKSHVRVQELFSGKDVPNIGLTKGALEVYPGMTEEQLNARLAEERKRYNYEALPGVTQDELKATIAAGRKELEAQREVMPGVTQDELKAKIATGRKKLEAQREVIPGVTTIELEARVTAERRKIQNNEVLSGLTGKPKRDE
jgi:hypothetical protein